MAKEAQSQSRLHPWVRTGICVAATLVVLAGIITSRKALVDSEYYLHDQLLRWTHKTPPNSNLVLVGFSKGQYEQGESNDTRQSPALTALRKPFPWSRVVWAELIEKLVAAGAAGVVLDVVLPGEREGNDRLAEVLARHKDKVVVGYQVMDSEKEGGDEVGLLLPSPELVPPSERGTEHDPRTGFVNIWPDADGRARTARFRISETSFLRQLRRDREARPDEPHMESLAARAVRLLGRGERLPPGEDSVRIRYTSAGPDRASLRFDVVELADLLAASYWKGNLKDGAFFRGKLVLVGPNGDIFHDEHRTPVADSALPGPMIHLNIINAVLQGQFIQVAGRDLNTMLILGAGGIAILLSWVVRSGFLRLPCCLVAAGLFGLLSYQLCDTRDLLVVTASPMYVLAASGIVTLGYDFRVEKKAREKLRATMDLYFSPKVSAYVLANPGSMEARSAEVTLLLTDLRNSTPLAEKLGPGGMFSLLNQVFEVETNAVMGQDGALEHFLGDQFLTYWGAPQPQPDGPNQALRAAMELIKGMESVKATQSPEVKALFGYGVALHRGSVLFGNKGSAKRLDFGLVGDTINEAARIEALTKYYGVTLLVSREVFARMTSPGPHRLLDRVIVKGKSTPVELLELENPRTPPNYAALVKEWDAAFANYTAGKFAEARPVFARLAEQFNDGPSKVMIHRCDELTSYPPADWKGVWKMESK